MRDDLADPVDHFWEMGTALADLSFHALPPAMSDAVLRGLEQLDRDIGSHPLTDVLAGAYHPLAKPPTPS